MNDKDAIIRIKKLIEADLAKLSPALRTWVEEHLVQPRLIVLSLNDDGQDKITLWLVTDHIGIRDVSSRIVFDSEQGKFGLEIELENGINWFMGLYGGFAEAVEAI